MAMKMQKKAVIPAGPNSGQIIAARETTKTFDQAKGPEPVVEITIQPDFKVEGATTLTVSVIFTPELNGLSALSKLLDRLDIEVAEGASWDPSSLNGTKVAFVAETNKNGFVRVVKDTIRAA
jgi:hypothetical protein